MVSIITASLFRQTLIPIGIYYKCLSHVYGVHHPSEVLRKTPGASLKENHEEAQRKRSGQRACKANNSKGTTQSPFYTKNSFMPIRFHPEPSMHRPACPDYCKTRLHSLPITISLENSVICGSPWSLVLGGCRWYSKPSGKCSIKEAVENLRTQDNSELETCYM